MSIGKMKFFGGVFSFFEENGSVRAFIKACGSELA
jgi:hypothetical protein